ncbi:MAG: hypothetical protein LUG49_06830 [Oscillospiraceae bacterium]|nr:hypothetical protein [Oscillospiraceae bacterium]
MQKILKKKIPTRLLCALLSALMIISVLPVGMVAESTVEGNNIISSSSMYQGYYNSYSLNEGGTSFTSDNTAVDSKGNNSGGQIGVTLGTTVSYGESITLKVTGTTDGPFRMWLLSGGDRASDARSVSELDGYKEGEDGFTFYITMTVNGGDSNATSANAVMFKGVAGSSTLPNMTITSIQIVTTEYDVTVNSQDNGIVSVDKTSAAEGDTVTLTASPADGYELSEWNVTYGDDNTAVTVASDGTFTMPAGNVTVSATFVEETAAVETVKVGDIVTVSGIKYTVVATDTDGSNGSSGSNNTGYGKWLESATISSYLTTTSEALIYVEYTSESTRYLANVGLQFNIDGSYKEVASNNTQPIFKDSSTLTYVTFSVADLVATAENTGYSVNNFAQIYSTLSTSTQTYIYSVSIVVPSSTNGGVCEEISSDKFKLSHVDENADGSYTGDGDQWSSYIDVPINTPEAGSTVVVHLTGTTSADFRVWLHTDKEGYDQASDISTYYYSSGSTFDTWIAFTVKSEVTDTSTIRIKGSSGVTLPTMTISHVGIVYEPTSTTSAAHTVNLTASGKGTITSDVTTAKSGATVTLTATAESGYELSSITVNGTEISGTTTFTMPNTDADVVATFVFSGNDDCGYSIAMSSDSVRSTFSDNVTVTEGESISSSASNFELILPYDVSVGGTVTVHIVGTSNSNFRIWLGDDWNAKSNQVNAVNDLGYSGSGDFDFTFTLTVDQDKSDAGYIMFKGVDSNTNLDNLTLTHVGITYQPPTFYGRSLTLDGEIGVTYYFNMDGVTNPDDYVLKATIDGETITVEASSEKKTVDGVEYYRYIVYVNPTQIDSTITAYLTNTDETVNVSTTDYSVYTYCEKAIKNTDGTWDAEKPLCEAVLNYAYYAEVYAENTSTLQSSLQTLDSAWENPVSDTWAALTGYDDTATSGVKKTLALSEGIYIRMYLTSDVASGTFTVNEETLTLVDSDLEGYSKYFEFKVPAKDMSSTFRVYKDGEEFTTYSVYSYVNNIAGYSGTDKSITDNLKKLCQAIYYYSKASITYGTNWR